MGIIVPAHREITLEPYNGAQLQTAWVFGDVHLSNLTTGDDTSDHGDVFAEHLHHSVNSTTNKGDKKTDDLLVINGDFFDFSESFVWQHESLPYTDKVNVMDKTKNIETLNAIANIHQKTVKAIQEFLAAKDTNRIVFTFGNHDHLLLIDDSLRATFQKLFLPEATDAKRNERIQFTSSLKLPAMKTQIEHGHRIDKFDYSQADEANQGDYLSYVKVMVIKKICDRLHNLEQHGMDKDLTKKMIDEVMKVDYVRDARAFPLYLKQLAYKYYSKHLSRYGKPIAMEIFNAIMSYKKDFISLLKETPLLGLLRKSPEWLLRNRFFEEFFMMRLNYIYKQQTHKNIFQLDDALKLHENDPHYTKYIRGHTHIHGRESSRPDPHEQIVEVFNNGTWIPLILAKRGGFLKLGTVFDKTLFPQQGVLVTRDLSQSDNGKSIEVVTNSQQSSYSRA